MSAGIFQPLRFTILSSKGLKVDSNNLVWLTKSPTLLVQGRSKGSTGFKVSCMKTWDPTNNKRFETLSYVKQPLSDEAIAKQIEYIFSKGWVPCLEFDKAGHLYRENSRMPGYYDGRYWTLWKLPMFGCQDASQVIDEIHACKKAYPDAFIRCIAFDPSRQCQCVAFLIHKPK